MIVCSSCLGRDALSLDAGDVSQALLVWSGAAETALADVVVLLQREVWFLGVGGLVSGLSGGHKVRKVRDSVADVHDAADFFLYRDSSFFARYEA